MKLIYSLFICIFILPSLSRAEFSYTIPASKVNYTELSIIGEIKKGDYEVFVNILKNFKEKESLTALNIYLESRGGDIMEAINIGKLIRNLRLTTNTSPTGYCSSACFLIYVAGIDKNAVISPDVISGRPLSNEVVNSALGIHRPRFSYSYYSGLSSNDAYKKYNELTNLVTEYLETMDVPKHIIEKMFSIPSNEIYYIHSDVATIELTGMVSSFKEWLISKCGSYTLDENIIYLKLKLNSNLNLNEKGTFLLNKVDKVDKCYEKVWFKEINSQAERLLQ